MIKKRTKTQFPILDKRGKSIGNFYISLKIEEVTFNEVNTLCKGFYYYVNENLETVILDSFSILFNWRDITIIEDNMLPDINSPNLKEVLTQRVLEFTDLQIQVESGDNYGTALEDWENI